MIQINHTYDREAVTLTAKGTPQSLIGRHR